MLINPGHPSTAAITLATGPLSHSKARDAVFDAGNVFDAGMNMRKMLLAQATAMFNSHVGSHSQSILCK